MHQVEIGTCSVKFNRNINVTILGKPSNSDHTLGALNERRMHK